MNNGIKFIFVLIIVVLFQACSNDANHTGILNEDDFVDVLVDIHMADATLVVQGFRIKADSNLIRLYYNDVLLKHNVTQVQVLNTFKYYTKYPKKFEKIYEKVSETIVKREEDFEENSNVKTKQDSLIKKEKKHILYDE